MDKFISGGCKLLKDGSEDLMSDRDSDGYSSDDGVENDFEMPNWPSELGG